MRVRGLHDRKPRVKTDHCVAGPRSRAQA